MTETISTITTESTPAINRVFKARIFEMVFSEKAELLELYNAANGTNYTNPELLEINTLENAIYMSMHNDISFIIDSRLNLYEHQSTYCPNLPLRYLMYISDLFSKITKDDNLYGEKLIPLPTPKFLIFYNGRDALPDSTTLKLSDAFIIKEDHVSLELQATMLNINPGHNVELLKTCKTLHDYSEYTWRVRHYAESMPIKDAVEKAVNECIQEGILADFLIKNRLEAIKVSIYEYDQEKHMRQEREASYIAGERNKLLSIIRKKISKGKNISEIADALEETEDTIESLIKEYNL